ncbi:hypothetical protein [Tautonia plasticadhaerens]|uniref:Uncharacterized protein n=1 Tax=Tautonia plasticadhaerens TaxID=2527974 RepID=A0A518H077_9BACT|nr:hypothetical protein [Tautonia plasticadhaerens]QDV34232.1 hypothetical protein ElP_21170 [Tautonia plasticadhaerens]
MLIPDVVIVSLASALSPPLPPMAELTSTEIRRELARFSMRVTLPGRSFRAGEPIPLSCAFENHSVEETTIWSRGFWANHLVTVTDEDDREPFLTPWGRERREAFAPFGPWSKNVRFRIGPGRSMVRAGEGSALVDLARMYVLGAGRYAVRVVYHETQEPAMRVESAPVLFEVR